MSSRGRRCRYTREEVIKIIKEEIDKCRAHIALVTFFAVLFSLVTLGFLGFTLYALPIEALIIGLAVFDIRRTRKYMRELKEQLEVTNLRDIPLGRRGKKRGLFRR